jgi:DNA repair protein RecN (Recombination protein N)
MADSHFLIEKESDGEETITKVTLLTGEASVGEVARLMGGSDVTETTMAAARELIAEK